MLSVSCWYSDTENTYEITRTDHVTEIELDTDRQTHLLCLTITALLGTFQVFIFLVDIKEANIDDICVVKHFVDVTEGLALGLWQDEYSKEDRDEGDWRKEIKSGVESKTGAHDRKHCHHQELLEN